MSQPDMRPMSTGEILDRAFQVLRRHFRVLVATALLGTAPALLLYAVLGVPYGMTTTSNGVPALAPAAGLLILLMFLSGLIVWAALARQVDRAATDGEVSIGDGLKAGVRSLLRLIGASIVAYLALIGVMLPSMIVGGILAAVMGPRTDNPVGIAVLVIVVAVPVLVGVVVWSSIALLMLPAIVVERVGPIHALRRANALAKGARVKLCAIALISWVIVMLAMVGLPMLFGVGLRVWDPASAGTISAGTLYLQQAITFLVGGVTTPFLAAAMVYAYYDRRVRREGYDVEIASDALAASV